MLLQCPHRVKLGAESPACFPHFGYRLPHGSPISITSLINQIMEPGSIKGRFALLLNDSA